jgi:hypothetical protein
MISPTSQSTVTVPVTLQGGQQLVDLRLGQMLPNPIDIIRNRPLVALRSISGFRSCTIFADIAWPPNGY